VSGWHSDGGGDLPDWPRERPATSAAESLPKINWISGWPAFPSSHSRRAFAHWLCRPTSSRQRSRPAVRPYEIREVQTGAPGAGEPAAHGAAASPDSVRLSEDAARRLHRTTARRNGPTAPTRAGCVFLPRLVRVGGTPWTGAGLDGQLPTEDLLVLSWSESATSRRRDEGDE